MSTYEWTKTMMKRSFEGCWVMSDFFLFFLKKFSLAIYVITTVRTHTGWVTSQDLGLTCHLSLYICVDYSHFLLLRDLKGPGIDFTVPCQVPARISSALSHADETVTPSEAAAKHPHLQTEIKS